MIYDYHHCNICNRNWEHQKCVMPEQLTIVCPACSSNGPKKTWNYRDEFLAWAKDTRKHGASK